MGRKFFLFLFVGLFLYVASPLLLPIAMGAVFAVLFFPWLDWLEKRKLSPKVSSAVLTIGITLVFILPTALLIFLAAKTALGQLRVLRESSTASADLSFFENVFNLPRVREFFETLSNWFPVGVDELLATTQDLARSIGIRLADLLGEFVTHLPGMFMAISITIVSIYFFLVDGRRLVHFIRRNSVFTPEQTDQLMESLGGMCRSVILATVAAGFMQAMIEVIACLLTRTPNAGLIGLLVFLASFLPLVGSVPVTLTVALQQLFLGRTEVGIGLLGAAALVATVDNVVRPMVLKGSANLHPLLAFVGAFGGLQVFGFSGVFLGPILAGLFVVTIEILIQGGETTLKG
jgi:predicted PurR-regulated permease PerM